jgi:hypothetical protein
MITKKKSNPKILKKENKINIKKQVIVDTQKSVDNQALQGKKTQPFRT